MADQSWHRVEELFAAALDIPPDQRAAFLDRECGGNSELRRETESLLAADAADGQNIASLVAGSAADFFDSGSLSGKRLGPYQVCEEIGRGGMAAVYSAIRADREYQKRVAVKVVKRGVDTDAVLDRFRHERQILAGLDHPYITRLLDGGTSHDGRPYFVMELVEGRPIQEYCAERHLTVRERCELFRKVCEAVAYAHRNLVIHRDLKPHNILVTAEGSPKLLDFGIARLLNVEPGQNTVWQSGHQTKALTPAYASPEQRRGEAINTATDIYSLGAVLYEILSGETPPANHADESDRTIPKPSETVRTDSDAASGKAVKRALAGDLDNIVLKATHPEQSQRYQSVDHLSDDLQSYLTGRPVQARDDRFSYRTGKFLRRNRVPVAAAILVIASLTTGLALSIAAQRKTQKRFNELRSLANSILFELHDEIAKLPGATRARSMVLQKAFTYLEGLAKDSAGDMSLQMELAEAYFRVGELQGYSLGESANSMVSFAKAVAIARAASAAEPGDPKPKLLLVEALGGLGGQETLSGHSESGHRHLDEASRTLETLVPAAGGDPGIAAEGASPDALELAVRESILLSGLARNEGEYLRALNELRRAARSVDLLRRITATDKARYLQSIVNWNLAIVLSQTGDLQTAGRTLDEAVKTVADLAARHPENASYGRQVWVVRHARAVFAGSPRSINEGDLATSRALYADAEAFHRKSFSADETNIREHVDFIAANFGTALVTSEISPAEGLSMLQENLKLCLALSPGVLETNLSNFSLAIVYRAAALAAARLHNWSLARDYLNRARPIQDDLVIRRPFFLSRLEHAAFLREMAAVEAGAGNRVAAQQRYREALAELDALADHRQEIFWVWKTTEVLEGLAEVSDRADVCALYTRSVDAWNRWKADGGPDSTFFRARRDRAQLAQSRCSHHPSLYHRL